MKTIKQEIELKIIRCPKCKGKGVVAITERINLHESDTQEQTCPYCEGKRVVQKETIVRHSTL